MVTYDRHSAVTFGLLGRRVASGPSILMNTKDQTYKEDYPRYDSVPPPYTPKAEEPRIKELKKEASGIGSPIRPFPRRRKDITAETHRTAASKSHCTAATPAYRVLAPKTQRKIPGYIPKANSCPPTSVGLGLGVNFRHGEELAIPTKEEKLLIRGQPSVMSRSAPWAPLFPAVHDFANYARAKAQVELGFIKPYCDTNLLLSSEEVYEPPKYTALPLISPYSFLGVAEKLDVSPAHLLTEWPATTFCEKSSPKLNYLNGCLYQDRQGNAPDYFEYRWV